MTTAADFADLKAAVGDDEVVTHSRVRDIPLPSGKTLALITLDNDRDHTRPSTLGPITLLELADVLDQLKQRAAKKEIDAVGVTGKQFIFAAGADLSKVSEIPSRAIAKQMALLGHWTLGKLSELGVPSFTFWNGLALGGGVEIGLNSTYRTVDSSVAAIALPEVSLGIIPGWGGAWLLPNLIGIESALDVIITKPLTQKTLKGQQVFDLGIADAIFGPANFLEKSLLWADGVLTGTIKVKRPNEPGKIERAVKWDVAIGIAQKTLAGRMGTVPKSPYRALDLLKAAKNTDKKTGFAAEDEALTDLISGDQGQASMYAFDLVNRRAKRPAGAPDKAIAKKITKVGIVGAGLMASQFAFLFVRRLKVPVVITDLDQERVDKGVASIHAEIQKSFDSGRITHDELNRWQALVTGTTNRADFADCDWIIEAVFEELGVKQDVFADIEQYISDEAVLATNTSSLSVEQIGAKLKHPERLVGFHFFNPVAIMPLVEVVKTPKTDDATLSTAMVTAAALGKNAVISTDTPGFVVNRILAKVLGEAMHAVDTGTPFEIVEEATRPFGLPMTPFQLLEFVGLPIGAHVLETHHAAFPERFFDSDNLRKLAEYGHILERDSKGKVKGYDPKAIAIVRGGTTPMTADELRVRIEDGLADEIHRMLDEHVVAAAEDIDLCLILGANYPFGAGGITPYLDRVGASERVFHDTFHHPEIKGIA
ncbi:MAG TPA: 3-hydroxyacyl-CoA dehydrogenase NAD-binding domain-containing protein [Galbitalea sp.]|jgi:3-hydroxyacyl-CoA dehydrogenase/enoyl-CoA hydratase/carnithine racemase|nr:3-hydroxyacyl-CoA dehydrogenase NAD-binding domain-containing protein [Galbitalea sp.]